MADILIGTLLLMCGLMAGGTGINFIKMAVGDYLDSNDTLTTALLGIAFGIIAIDFGALLLWGAHLAYIGELVK